MSDNYVDSLDLYVYLSGKKKPLELLQVIILFWLVRCYRYVDLSENNVVNLVLKQYGHGHACIYLIWKVSDKSTYMYLHVADKTA